MHEGRKVPFTLHLINQMSKKLVVDLLKLTNEKVQQII